MRYCFPKSSRLLRRREFVSVIKKSQQKVGRFLLADFFYSEEKNSKPKLGITVSTKFGNSCVRNRFKRLVREVFRLCQHDLPPGLRLIIRPRSYAQSAKLSDLMSELKRFFMSHPTGLK